MILGCEILLTMHTLLANAVCADSFPDDDAIQRNHHKPMHNALVFCCPCKRLLTVAAIAFFQLLWRTCDTLTNFYNHILFMNKCNEMTSQNLACMINFILPLQTNENISKQTVHNIDWDNALSVLLLFILTCSQLDCPIYTYSGIDETIPQAFA